MKNIPSYLKERSIENNVCASVNMWDNDDNIGVSSCSSCCFRNWRKMCDKMPCYDNKRHTSVFWYALHVPENDVMILLNHFVDNGGNSQELAEKKKYEMFNFLEAGNTVEEWKNKKYADAWKGMGRG